MNETFRDARLNSSLKRHPVNFTGNLVKTKNTFTIRIENGQAPLDVENAKKLAEDLRQ